MAVDSLDPLAVGVLLLLVVRLAAVLVLAHLWVLLVAAKAFGRRALVHSLGPRWCSPNCWVGDVAEAAQSLADFQLAFL